MRAASALLASILFFGHSDVTSTPRDVTVHGRTQVVRVYGTAGARTAIVSSGDGGWIHLAPHVAALLASRGWFVLGFDSRAYLSSVSASGPVTLQDIPRDYEALLNMGSASASRPILIGVSEGAGLSVAAAADPELKHRLAGVVAIGLGDANELAWHARDAIIYLTKGAPREPAFHATEVARLVAPLPMAMLRPTVDEYVPQPESDRVYQSAREPKKMWTIAAGNHRFSDNLGAFDDQLVAALDWIDSATGGR